MLRLRRRAPRRRVPFGDALRLLIISVGFVEPGADSGAGSLHRAVDRGDDTSSTSTVSCTASSASCTDPSSR
jgi:hypothetical protein